MVFLGFVTAWRLASWPTSRSPVFVKATTDGTVRPPSAEAMTVGSPPSMTATTLFVVPRSMPMILAIVVSLLCLGGPGLVVPDGDGSVRGRRVRRRVGCGGGLARGDRDERGPDHPVAQPVAAADDVDDLALGPAAAG